MDRRNALKLFGALFVCLAGHPVHAEDLIVDSGTMKMSGDWLSRPTDYTFNEEGIGNIVIERKDGTRLIVPFSDIVEALSK